MPLEKHVLCVSTTSPSTSLSPSGGGGTMTVIDPMTGACLSSLRVTADMTGKSALGIASGSPFPSSFSRISSNTRPIIAYGTNKAKKGDTYAMLLSIRSASSPPILHWKCRLPEADMSGGLSVSPCGCYVVGGGASGNCFVWSTGGGVLLRTFKAHYRAVTCLSWSDCCRYLVTGGGDGMVHIFLLMELVDKSSRLSKRAITPLNTWSFHHFPVTCLSPMDSGRMASSAEDGHIVVMELFSKTILATFKVPDGVTCLAYHDNRLFVGTISGAILSIDLDAYAMLETEKRGASLSQAERKRQEEFLTTQEKIFGKPKEEEGASSRLYLSDWIGHDRCVSSIAFLVEGPEERLISGDVRGEVRIWDVESRTSLKVLQPWANTVGGAIATVKKDEASKSSEGSNNHPISSILIMAQPNDGKAGSGEMFGSTAASHPKRQAGLAALIPPLQRFPEEQQASDSPSSILAVPFLNLNRSPESIRFWEPRTIARTRKRHVLQAFNDGNNEAPTELEEARKRVAQLEQQLAAKTAEVARWETVNNKLMDKLKVKN